MDIRKITQHGGQDHTDHDVLCETLVAAETCCPEIIGVAYMIYYGREGLDEGRVNAALDRMEDKMAKLNAAYAVFKAMVERVDA